MNNKIVEMSHNVCYRKDNLRYSLGDIVIWLDDPYVVVSVLLDADKNRYVLRDSDGGEILVYEYEILPFVKIGDYVKICRDVDAYWYIVKKICKSRCFVYNEETHFGFWLSFSDIVVVKSVNNKSK